MDDDKASKQSSSKDNTWLEIPFELEIWLARVGAIETVKIIKPRLGSQVCYSSEYFR